MVRHAPGDREVREGEVVGLSLSDHPEISFDLIAEKRQAPIVGRQCESPELIPRTPATQWKENLPAPGLRVDD